MPMTKLKIKAENLDNVIKSQEKDSIKLFQWFPDKQMKEKPDKCYRVNGGKHLVSMKGLPDRKH